MSDGGEIEAGRRLVRVDATRKSLGDRVADFFHRVTWGTALHQHRLRGRYPLKLLAVPQDPLAGDAVRGGAFLSGTARFAGYSLSLPDYHFTETLPAPMEAYMQRFRWLRDIAAAGERSEVAPIAEHMMRRWLDNHGDKATDHGWTAGHCGWRILHWAAHAPLILSSKDIVYRSAVLNSLARQTRHLDRAAERAAPGLERVAGWSGVVASGLLLPGGEVRRVQGEAGLARALAAATTPDGGIIGRRPDDLAALVELLSLLVRAYDAVRVEVPEAVRDGLNKAVAALLGLTLGDGALSSWQGCGIGLVEDWQALIAASGVRTRPLRQAREWGYQRLAAGQTVLVMDAGAPPPSKLSIPGAASTLAFELSDHDQRIIVNCGGADGVTRLADALAQGLRTTAAHSTLVVDDTNSTTLNPDGSLGTGVTTIALDRQESDGSSRIEATHDGYGRRFGLMHRRVIAMTADGREVHGEDALLPVGRKRRRPVGFAARFHLAPGIEATLTADAQGALLRGDDGRLWQFRARGGSIAVEDSVWVDGHGRPRMTSQLVLAGEAPAGGASVAWLLRRA